MTVILVLSTIAVFLLIDQAVQRVRVAPALLLAAGEWLGTIPGRVRLSVNHMWMRRGFNGVITLGMDPLLSSLLGPTARVTIPQEGSIVSDDETAVRVHVGDNVLSVASPVSGWVVRTNKRLGMTPSLLMKAPFGGGWLMKVRPNQYTDRSSKFVASSGAEWLHRQASSIREFITSCSGAGGLVTLQDGGLPVNGVLGSLDPLSLEEFRKLFVTLVPPYETSSDGEEKHAATIGSSH